MRSRPGEHPIGWKPIAMAKVDPSVLAEVVLTDHHEIARMVLRESDATVLPALLIRKRFLNESIPTATDRFRKKSLSNITSK
jgi:hypothetical protein